MAIGMGVGVGLDLSQLTTQINKANAQFTLLVSNAQRTAKEISTAFNRGGRDGIRAFIQELQNAEGALSSLNAAGGKIRLSPQGFKSESRVMVNAIDQVNQIVNRTRMEFEKLNATKLRPQIDKHTSINSITELEQRLQVLQQRLKTGTFALSGEVLSSDQRVNTANEITAIQERLNVLRMSTAEYQRLKAQESASVLEHARVVTENTQKEIEEGKRRAQQVLDNYNKELQAAKASYQERYQMYADMWKKMDQEASRRRASEYQRTQQYGDTSNQAKAAYNRLYSDKGVMSIQTMESTLRKLENAQEKLNLKTEEGRKKYQELDEMIQRVRGDLDKARSSTENFAKSGDKAKKKIKEAKDETDALSKQTAALGQMFIATFALRAIKQFIGNMVKLRGEFELQQKSLQAIMQDKDMANEVWDRTVALAVKSPFKVKELVTYTKQLAAYRIENEKLYDTTKMLADVSAGLGVDMNRLILAYGQVKAATYLRATELRQFTEAGVNMLGELSKYYSEIENKAISVGDVMQRISKRRVAFADVDQVLQRMTSAGGVFYQMQEKQANTIQGMMLNLRDSVDLMFNDMGKNSEGTIKKTIKFVRSLVDSWRALRPVIITAGAAMFTYFGSAAMAKIATAMASITATNPWISVLTAIAAVGAAIYGVATAQSKFKASMLEVDNDVMQSLKESIALYHELADTINDATESNENRNKAYEELKSQFKSILPDQYLEKSYVEEMAGNYAKAESAMRSYYNAKAIEQKKDRVEQQFVSEFEGTDVPELITSTEQALKNYFRESERWINKVSGVERVDEGMRLRLLSGVSGVINSVVDDIKGGKIDTAPEEIEQAIMDRLATYAGYTFNKSVWDVSLKAKFIEDINDIIKTSKTYLKRIKSITGLSFETFEEEQASNWILNEKKKVEIATSAFKQAVSLYQKYVDAKPKADKTIEEQRAEIEEDVKALTQKLPENMTERYVEVLDNVFYRLGYAAKKGKTEYAKVLQQTEADLYKTELAWAAEGDILQLMGIGRGALEHGLSEELNQAAVDLVDNFVEELKDKGKNMDLSEFQQGVFDAIQVVSEKFKLDDDVFKDFVPKADETLTGLRDKVKNRIDEMTNEVKAFRTSVQQGHKDVTSALFSMELAHVEELEKQIPALEFFWKLLGGFKKTSSGGDKRMQELKNQISLIKEMNSEYEKLIENMTEEEAKLEVINSYRETLKAAGLEKLGFNIDEMDFTDEGTILSLEKLLEVPKYKANKYALEIKKALDNIKVELKVEAKIEKREELQKKVDKLFDTLELSKEIDKSGLGKALGESIWKIDHMTTKDVKDSLEKLKPEFEALGKNGVKAYEDAMNKLNDIEKKDAKERIETYTKYLKKGVSESVKLKLEEMRKLKEIEEMAEKGEIPQEQKTRIQQGIREESKKEQQSQTWKDFKESDMYIMMFEDLEHYGTAAIDMLYTKLSELKKNLSELPANEVKEIVQQIEKLENIKIERNPFKSWSTYAKEVKALMEEGLTEDVLQEKLLDEQKAEAYAQSIIDVIDRVQQGVIAGGKQEDIIATFTPEEVAIWNEVSEIAQMTGQSLDDIASSQARFVNLSKRAQATIVSQQQSYKRLSKSQQDSFTLTEKYLNEIQNVFNASKELMASLGVESDSVAMTIADTGSSMVSLILSAVQFTAQLQIMGVAANSALGIIGWIAIAIQAVATILTAIFTAKDNELKKQVEASQREVEKLSKDFEDLENKIDEAWNVGQLQQYNTELRNTTSLMIEAQKAAIAAQEQRKGAAKEGSDTWEELQDMKEELKDMENNLEDVLAESVSKATGGILDSAFDAAKEFTDAWYDAFKETGDGLTGLQENFDEMFMNLAKNQAAMQITGYFTQQWKDALGKYVNEKDTELTKEDAIAWAEEVRASFPALNEALEGFLGTLSETVDATGSLSELQKGIQGITEETAQVLESLLNSMRFYVANTNSEIRTQTTILRDIRTALQDVIRPDGSVAMNARLV